MKIFKKIGEKAFEAMLAVFAGVSNFTQAAKDLKVSVKIDNTVDPEDSNSKVAVLAKDTWTDLFAEKKRCQLDGAINTPDLTFAIAAKDGKLTVVVQSAYLEKTNPETELGKAFKQFIEDANETIDHIFDRDRSLNLDEKIASASPTMQVHQLSEFFEDKLEKIFFSVLVHKFSTLISK